MNWHQSASAGQDRQALDADPRSWSGKIMLIRPKSTLQFPQFFFFKGRFATCLAPLDGDALHLHDVGDGWDGGGGPAARILQVLLGQRPAQQPVAVLVDAVHRLQVQPVVLPVQLTYVHPCNLFFRVRRGSVGRAPACCKQARVRISARHPREVPPLSQHQWRKWRWVSAYVREW